MKNKKLFQSLAIVGTFLVHSFAHAQTASIESEVGVSQQYVDSIMNSLGSASAQVDYNYSADFKEIGPAIQETTKNSLSEFRAFMGVLGISSGLSNAVQDYNQLVKENASEENKASQLEVIKQQALTAETLYQGALQKLYQANQAVLLTQFICEKPNTNPKNCIAKFADQSTKPIKDEELLLVALPIFPHVPSALSSNSWPFKDFHYQRIYGYEEGLKLYTDKLSEIMKQRYQSYLSEHCGSKYCITNVMSAWSRYYTKINRQINRNLTVTLADGKEVVIRSLALANESSFSMDSIWDVQYLPFFKAITTFTVDSNFAQLPLQVNQWPSKN